MVQVQEFKHVRILLTSGGRMESKIKKILSSCLGVSSWKHCSLSESLLYHSKRSLLRWFRCLVDRPSGISRKSKWEEALGFSQYLLVRLHFLAVLVIPQFFPWGAGEGSSKQNYKHVLISPKCRIQDVTICTFCNTLKMPKWFANTIS